MGRQVSSVLGQRLLEEAKNNNLSNVIKVISKGASLAYSDQLGMNSIHWAAYNNSVEMCELILQGARLLHDAHNGMGRTPLHIAGHLGHSELLEVLLEYGANPNMTDMLKMTALHWSVEGGHINCVTMLLNKGADPNMVSKFGKTAYNIAEDKSNPQMMLLLLNHERRKKNAKKNHSPVKRRVIIMRNAKMKKAKIDGDQISEIHLDKANISRGNLHAPKSREKKQEKLKISKLETKSWNDTMAMLKQHGIHLLEPDSGTVVTSAVQSGQKVILTEAGKLALKSSPICQKKKSNLPRVLISKTKLNSSKNIIANDGNKEADDFMESFKGNKLPPGGIPDLINMLKTKISDTRIQARRFETLALNKHKEVEKYESYLKEVLRKYGLGKIYLDKYIQKQ